MIFKRKFTNGARTASAWQTPAWLDPEGDCGGIYFGVTDHNPALGLINNDENGNAVIFIFEDECKAANVKVVRCKSEEAST